MRRFLAAPDRDRMLAAWALARLVLGELLGIPACEVPVLRECRRCGARGHGKPRLAGETGWRFSLSHSGERVVVAVTELGPIGVDVEAGSGRIDHLAPRILEPGETAVGRSDLLRYWVRKEAVLKATGDGLAVPMTSFAVSSPGVPGRLLRWPPEPDLPIRMTLLDLDCDPGYTAAVAVIGTPNIDRFETHDGSRRLRAVAHQAPRRPRPPTGPY